MSPLFNLFRYRGKSGNEFHHDFDNDLSHSSRGRNLGINIEAVQEVFNGLEQVGKSVVASADVLDRLRQSCVIRCTAENKQGSYSKKDGEANKNGICRQERL